MENTNNETKNGNTTQEKNSCASCAVGAIFLIGVIIFGWEVIQSYRKELHYVCFNQQCDYVLAKDYDINWLGNCLTRTDLVMQTKQCGGSIEISKPNTSFLERLKSVYKQK